MERPYPTRPCTDDPLPGALGSHVAPGHGFENATGGEDMPAHADLARAMYRAYETGDRSAIEPLIADPFEFWSPLDDGIDRETYFDRCWPNHESIEAIELLRVAEL